jgi:uncharacterized protein YjdB
MVFKLSVGEIMQVKASANPRNANTATADYVTFDWKSDNTSVATVEEDAETHTAVDKTGKITIVGKGKARVTVSCGDVKAKIIIIEGV